MEIKIYCSTIILLNWITYLKLIKFYLLLLMFISYFFLFINSGDNYEFASDVLLRAHYYY